jgi:Protein of unknown function (DUF3567)
MHMLYDSESFVVVHMQAEFAASAFVLAKGERAEIPNALDAPRPTDAIRSEDGPRLARHGFEIVDKRSGKEVYLDGSWAELFQEQINAWQANTPTQEEVEEQLERYAALAQNPVLLH